MSLDKQKRPENMLFDELYRSYAPLLLRRCMQYVKSREIAEDLTHTVFVKAMGRIDQFRSDASPYTWLYRIATNLCLNHLRDHRRELFVDHDALETLLVSSTDELDLPLKKVLVEELFKGFCTVTRRIVFLAVFERLSQEEIAKVLDISRTSVQKRWNEFLTRARRRCEAKPAGNRGES